MATTGVNFKIYFAVAAPRKNQRLWNSSANRWSAGDALLAS